MMIFSLLCSDPEAEEDAELMARVIAMNKRANQKPRAPRQKKAPATPRKRAPKVKKEKVLITVCFFWSTPVYIIICIKFPVTTSNRPTVSVVGAAVLI